MSAACRRAVAGALACCALLCACNPQPEKHAAATPSPAATATGVPPLRITGRGTKQQPVKIVQLSGNRKLYELQAHWYESRSAQSVASATFHQASVMFYDKDGTTLTAHAPLATLDGHSKNVVLTGGVHAKTSTGLVLVCDRLNYDRATGLIHGEGNVRITGMQNGSQEVLTGNRFTSDVRLQRMVMK